MKFAALQRRVQRAESVLERREEYARTCWSNTKTAWREGWTPLRIVSAGLVAGFLTGRAEPLAATLNGPRALRMVSAVSSLFASVQATVAAGKAGAAEEAAGAAEAKAGEAADVSSAVAVATGAPTPRTDARVDAEAVHVAPRPAEAATELSEH